MNLYLHNVDTHVTPIKAGVDALAQPANRTFSVVLTNPPFGTKGSLAATADSPEDDISGRYLRDDFWVSTANKQLNFLQHAVTLLDRYGRCAIVVPDNVLFEGGAGAVIRLKLMQQCHVHTLLRLPPGIFYAQGVKANVLFFDRERPPKAGALWVYDFRTNKHFTLRQRQIGRSDFDEFVEFYKSGEIGKRQPSWTESDAQGRWRRFEYDTLLRRDKLNLDLSWLNDQRAAAATLPQPQELAARISDDLRSAWEAFERISRKLDGE
jgi:type I restriction enzyme M protein